MPNIDRLVAISALRYLLYEKELGAWGMDALISILNKLIPEFAENPVRSGTFPD